MPQVWQVNKHFDKSVTNTEILKKKHIGKLRPDIAVVLFQWAAGVVRWLIVNVLLTPLK